MSNTPDTSFFIILSNLGRFGIVTDERDVTKTKMHAIIDIASGQFDDPLSVFEFNPAKCWSKDISEDIAMAILEGYPVGDMSAGARKFVLRHLSTVQLRRAA